MCEGKAGYKPADRRVGERQHLIGTGDRPIYICKKKEVPELFTPLYWYIFDIWQGLHYKTLVPGTSNYNQLNPDILQTAMMLKEHYDTNFSQTAYITKLLESVIKHLRVIGGIK